MKISINRVPRRTVIRHFYDHELMEIKEVTEYMSFKTTVILEIGGWYKEWSFG